MTECFNEILLDTSIVVAHLRGDMNVLALTATTETSLFIPLVVLEELYKGTLSSTRPEHNRHRVDDFLSIAGLLHPDSATAEVYAKIAV